MVEPQQADRAAPRDASRAFAQSVAGGLRRYAAELVLEFQQPLPGQFMVGMLRAPAGAVGLVGGVDVFRPQARHPFGCPLHDGGVDGPIQALGI
jgi:hypothetical protein